MLAQKLIREITINPINKETSILKLNIKGRTPKKSIQILNKLTEVYIRNSLNEKNLMAINTIHFIDEQLTVIKDSLTLIENQLEKSDHGHLGQIITYLVSIGAKTAIWIVSKPRTEHINAINWLNESSSADFYLLKVEAIKIGDSPPAPLLTVIVEPSAESKEVGNYLPKENLNQTSLFEEDILSFIKDLKNININEITPMEALRLLDDMKKKYES